MASKEQVSRLLSDSAADLLIIPDLL